MQNLNCFIASAFGYNDVDLIYDKSIRPVLKTLSINPHRVDRINHNEKIDKKIIDLINQCDFGIIDLTYARPSAYFEAGYLEGLRKPTIYICRKDHFIPDKDDKAGNKRVHFDLLTKNIIDWNKPSTSFSKRLRSRIKLVTRPLLIEKKKTQELSNAVNHFSSLSISKRLSTLDTLFREHLRKKKFKKIPNNRMNNDVFKYGKSVLMFKVLDTITQNDFFQIRVSNHKNIFPNHKIILCLISLSKITSNRIGKSLWLYAPISPNIFQHDETVFLLLDDIKSELTFQEKLENLDWKKLRATSGFSTP
jgi:hypothetical protein